MESCLSNFRNHIRLFCLSYDSRLPLYKLCNYAEVGTAFADSTPPIFCAYGNVDSWSLRIYNLWISIPQVCILIQIVSRV